MIKAVILDFDGTLVSKDILDVICSIVGKEKESAEINENFHSGKIQGIMPLIERINLLQGVWVSQIKQKLDKEAYVMPGAKDLLIFLQNAHIISILASGNILPVLRYYQNLLSIDYIVGSTPIMKGEIITGISEENFSSQDFKLSGVKKVIENLNIKPSETLAIGDSPADKSLFLFSGKSIAINPKGGIEKFATYTIGNNLMHAIPIIQSF